jgi:hypothetical protein
MRHLLVLSLLLASPSARAETNAQLPAWLAGCWRHAEGERWTEECWTAPHGGQMVGSGHAGVGEAVESFEFMRIELVEHGVVFLAAPGGKDWTLFPSAPDAEGGVTFLNTRHDYPQRIRYWREGDRLNAEISLGDGSRAERWSYKRVD